MTPGPRKGPTTRQNVTQGSSPPPTAPKTVAHPSGSHIGWRRPPWSRSLGNYRATGGIVPFVTPTFEWGVATFLSVLSIVPRHCARLTHFLHPKWRKLNAVLITHRYLPLPCGAPKPPWGERVVENRKAPRGPWRPPKTFDGGVRGKGGKANSAQKCATQGRHPQSSVK